MNYSLEKLIYPTSLNDFMSFLYLKNAFKSTSIETISNLDFSWTTFNDLINTKKIPYSKINLYYQGNLISRPRDHLDILRACSSGADIIIEEINLHNKNIAKLVCDLSDQIRNNIVVDLYIKSPEPYPKSVISNENDLIFICLEGSFNIQVYKANSIDNKLPYFECVLKKGDLVYIPVKNNYIISSNQSSIGLFVGIVNNNANNFLDWFINYILVKDKQFHDSFPLNISERSILSGQFKASEESIEILRNLKKSFLEKLRDPNLMKEYENYLIKTQKGLPTYSFPNIFLDSLVQSLDNIHFERSSSQSSVFEYEKNMVLIYFWRRKLVYEIKFSTLLEFIFSTNSFYGHQLEKFESELNKEDILLIINDLVQQGILSFRTIESA